MMKRLLLTTATLLLVPAGLHAQSAQADPQAPQATRTSGHVSTGVQGFDNDTNSSKFTEYRDFRNNLNLFNLRADVLAPASGRFLDISARNLTRRDQDFLISAGNLRTWRFDLLWNEIPHNMSNRAMSPYIYRGNGLFEVPATIPIGFKRLATAAADAPSVVATDFLIADYAQRFIAPADLATHRRTGNARFRWDPHEALRLEAGFWRDRQTGTRLTYGPMGDRPPRTLNIELTEPVDYRTRDLTLAAEHQGRGYQTRFEVLHSQFANGEDTLVWRNIYATPEPGSDFDVWDRAVAAYGRRPLPPDNSYSQATVSAGGDLPLGSRLNASVSYGRLSQNQGLLPYAFHVGQLAVQTLPRGTADARMSTVAFNADYTISPLPRLSLRSFYRRYDLNNDTPADNWLYVTSDTSNLNGTVSYKNHRVSLPYGWDRQNAGLDATYRLRFWRSSLGIGYERESIGREFREADTGENIVRATWRARPMQGVTLRARYLYGNRSAGDYDAYVTRLSYWYAPAAPTDNDNPQFTFSNHPDMRRYDVTDRVRNQGDFTVGITPRGNLSLSASVRLRSDDFGSGVVGVQPLLQMPVADREAFTPGDQLGLLDEDRRRWTVDAFYMPHDRVTLNAFVGGEWLAGFQRSLEYNENNKQNPSAVALAALGPWTRRGNQWTADINDDTRHFGGGATFGIVPGRVSLSTNYTASLGRMNIHYAGFGVTNFDGTPFPPNHEFAFRTPPTIRHDLHVLDARLEFPIVRNVLMLVGYMYDRYRIEDWQQETTHLWVEPVGTEYLLRDTSRSHQWGNRLFNMGSYLAPTYRAHLGWAAFNYRF
jgi:MtrB/PioB family decaheme-associated outer membrane protein